MASSLLLDGRSVPLASVEPERVVLQVPWETAPGKYKIEVRTEADPHFEREPIEFEVRDRIYAQFEFLGNEFERSIAGERYALAAHSDFSAVVSRANPARAGGIIHLFMTGLGPVEPAAVTGEAAPSNPAARIRALITCWFVRPAGYGIPPPAVEPLFAGLAPGYAGYYQVSLRLPEDLPLGNGDALLSCAVGVIDSRAWLPVAAAAR